MWFRCNWFLKEQNFFETKMSMNILCFKNIIHIIHLDNIDVIKISCKVQCNDDTYIIRYPYIVLYFTWYFLFMCHYKLQYHKWTTSKS